MPRAIRASRLRKLGANGLTLGAVTALGFLSFAGMFAITPVLGVCVASFALAVGFEAQMFSEGIYVAFKRLFSDYYLQRGIMRKFLEDCEVQATTNERIRQNVFLKDYFTLKNYLKKFQEHHHLTKAQKRKRAEARRQLAWMEIFIFKQLQAVKEGRDTRTGMERIARELIADKLVLLDEIKNKSRWIKFGAVLALFGGASSGFTAISSIQVGLAAFAISSAIPGGVIIFAGVLAMIAYTFILYQAFSDMVQEYQSLKAYVVKRPNESNLTYGLRLVGIAVVTTAALIAVIASAGTAWFAAKKGAEFFMSGGAAEVVQIIAVAIGALPTFFFSLANSLKSVDGISRSNYKALAHKNMHKISKIWKVEKAWAERLALKQFVIPLAILRFINPFRALEVALSKIGQGLYFIAHVCSIAVTADRFNKFRPEMTIAAGGVAEAATDAPYLPGGCGHNHQSWLLTLVMSPLLLTIGILRVFSVCYDALFFSKSLKQSWHRQKKLLNAEHDHDHAEHHHEHKHDHHHDVEDYYILAEEKDHSAELDQPPELSQEWRRQAVIQVCDDIEGSLRTKSSDIAKAKVQSAQTIRRNVLTILDRQQKKEKSLQGMNMDMESIEELEHEVPKGVRDPLNYITALPLTELAAPLAKNRNQFWYHNKTRSEYDMDIALEGYNNLRQPTAAPAA